MTNTSNEPQRTQRVRIAVAIDHKGKWIAYGDSRLADKERPIQVLDCMVDDLESGEAFYWVTAELPVPEACEVEGEVSQ